jgi:broad specificity phosphatase PhoE
MKLYLVRHGQSNGNLNKRHQHSDTPLSDLGKQQAQELARRFSTIPIDIILTSHFDRARETAKIVATEIDRPLETSELLREIKRPSEIEGKLTSDPNAVDIKDKIKANIHDPNWHYSDEENVYDLIARAKDFLKSLENHKEVNILAVSHGRIIEAIVGTVVLGDSLVPELFDQIKDSMYLSNTGITVLEKTNNQWHLLTWNDNAHLGNI